MHTRLFVTWGMKLKLISSIYCICLSFCRQVKLDAFYLSTFDLMEEKIVHGQDFAYRALPLCKSLCILSTNYFKYFQLPHCFSEAPLHFQLSNQTWVL